MKEGLDLRKTQQDYYMFFFGILLLMCFGVLAVVISKNPINSFDLKLAAFVQSFENPSLTKVMEVFTAIGSTKYCVAIIVLAMIFLYFVLGHRTELIFLCGVLGGSVVLNQILKRLFHRERPSVYRLIEESGYSFPSGHAMGALALYGALAFLLWRHVSTRAGRSILIVLSGFMIGMICISRVYLGVHYPSDIIGALMVSGFWLVMMIWLCRPYVGYQERISASNIEA